MSLLTLLQSTVVTATQTQARGGGLAPSKKEWELYLKRWHELRRERAALRAANRGLRTVLREQLFPAPPPKPIPAKVLARLEPEKHTRLPSLATFDDRELRTKIAALLIDLRKRTREAKRRKKQRRDEEALMHLL